MGQRAFLLCALMSTFFIPLVSVAALSDPVSIRGKAVTADGQPVAGADVWLVRSEWENLRRTGALVASTQTSEDGSFVLNEMEFGRRHDPDRQDCVVCYKPGLALGWRGIQWVGQLPDVRPGVLVWEPDIRWEPEPIEITLQPSRIWRCALVDRDGGPVRRARVQVTSAAVFFSTPDGKRRGRQLYVPPELVPLLTLTVGPDGVATTEVLPAGASGSLRIGAPGYGTVRVWTRIDEPETIRLGKAAHVGGRLVCAERPGEAIGRTVSFSGYHSKDEAGHHFSPVLEEVTSDEAGQFLIPAVPPGWYDISVSMGKTGKWQAEKIKNFRVEPGARLDDFEIALDRAWPVTGRIVELRSGQPMPNLPVLASMCPWRGRIDTQTRKDGRYCFYALPGTVTVTFRAPEGYLRAGDTEREFEVTAGKEVRLPEFRVKPDASPA